MRPTGSSAARRRRAAGLLLVCITLAAGTTFAKGSHRVPLDGAPDQAAADVLHAARNQVGDAYAWGGDGPDAWDCSGLTSLWRTVGGAKTMPRVSRHQQAWTIPVAPDDLQRGDLVFFGHPVTHVGIVSGGGWMIDASESRKGVVHRPIWKTGVVRYGRVPRPGMPRVRPWTPPPLPPATPDARVADSPAVAAAPRPAPKPVAAPRSTSGLTPLKGLPPKQALSSLVAYRAAAAGRTLAGEPAGPGAWGDVGVVQHAWRSAGGGQLPTDRAKIVARGRQVPLSDARIGDLVVYGRPAIPHLGIYLGSGRMVDASPKQGRVVIRPVYAASTVKLVRLG